MLACPVVQSAGWPPADTVPHGNLIREPHSSAGPHPNARPHDQIATGTVFEVSSIAPTVSAPTVSAPTVSAPTVSAPTVRARTGVAGLAVQDSLPRLDVAPAATHARVAADVVGPGGLSSVPPDPALDASRRTHGSGSGRLTSSVCARRDTSARVAPPGWAPSACDWPWRRMCRRPQRLWRSALLNETLRSDEHPMCVTFPRAGLLASAGSTVMTQVTVPLLPGARRVHPRGTVYR